MLSRKVCTSLRGRRPATVIRPFGFRKYLPHLGEEPRNEPRRWKPAAKEELIQVRADLSSPDTRARELRALTEAAKDHPRATQRLLVLDRDALALADAPGIEVVPAYEWLLAAPDESR